MNKGKKRRIVIKIGSNLITENENILNDSVIENLCNQISEVQDNGNEIIIVSSGAVAAGRQYLSTFNKEIKINDSYLVHKQVLASIGQPMLMKAYENFFSKNNKGISQALISREDFENRSGYLNVRNTLNELLEIQIIPIINENDVVATEEIRFGDNDTLAAMVSNMMEADLMVILTNQDGYFDKNPDKYPDAKIIKKCNIKDLNEDDFNLDEKSSVGTGGFKTKIRSVKMATTRNCPSIIASGYRKDVIKQILSKKIIGTFFYSEE